LSDQFTERFPTLCALGGTPDALRGMSEQELQVLAGEMREAIIATVSQTGGHLGPSLGTVELTIALHCELQSPTDKIIWDVEAAHRAPGRVPDAAPARRHQRVPAP